MATAFKPSGTGLQSEIQSGSGGITSTDTSVEVDSIPSDLSAGDSVKVAIGGNAYASENGETVYADIGTIGGGANGGTNLNNLSRGQEGTSASSWSEDDPVRVGVQGRDDVGPERPVVQSGLVKGSERLSHYADFHGVTQADVNGYTIASGQSLTVQTGAWEIQNGLLRNTNTPAVITFPQTTVSSDFIAQLYTDSLNAGDDFGVLGEYKDIDNYIYTHLNGALGTLIITEKASGSFSELNTYGLPSSYVGDSLFRLRWAQENTSDFRAMSSPLSGAMAAAANETLDLSVKNAQGFVVQSGTMRVEGFRVYTPDVT